jgi:hypothetical protein
VRQKPKQCKGEAADAQTTSVNRISFFFFLNLFYLMTPAVSNFIYSYFIFH